MTEAEYKKRYSRERTNTLAMKCTTCEAIEEYPANHCDGVVCPHCGGCPAPWGYLKPAAPRTPHIQHEGNEQAALFRWAAFARCTHPELDLLYHIPNGGSRTAREGASLKREGVKAGVPDLCLPVARGEFHGLYIELKCKGNTTTPKQKEWLSALSGQGYVAVVCYGWQEAQEVITKYLEMGCGK